MLGKTFAKLHETFETMADEIKEVVASAAGGDSEIKVEVENGNVSITGPLKELTINGKRVRFKTEQSEEPPK